MTDELKLDLTQPPTIHDTGRTAVDDMNPLRRHCFEQGMTGVDYQDAIERCRVRADTKYDPCGVLRDEFGIDNADLAVELVKICKTK